MGYARLPCKQWFDRARESKQGLVWFVNREFWSASSSRVLDRADLSSVLYDRGWMSIHWLFAAIVTSATACGRIDFEPLTAPDDGIALLDTDGDGIPDTTDNCVDTANPDQANEDGDAFGDACDPCPPFADQVPVADADDDGVADACDPFPTTPGDKIALFDGFNTSPAAADVDGTWSFDGAARVTSSLDEESAVTWVVPAAAQQIVSTSVTPDEYFGNLVARPVGVVSQYRLASRDGTMCVFGINPSNQQVVAIADNRSTTALAAKSCVATVGTTATFRMFEASGKYDCESSQIGTPISTTSSLLSNPNRIGVFARSTSAHFDWVMIVSSP